MNAESAIAWLETEHFNQWRLCRGDDEKVSEYSSEAESETEALERLTAILKLQQPGKYSLKAHHGKSKQASASTFRFDITRPVSAAPAHNNAPQNFDYAEIFEKGRALAKAEFESEQFKREVFGRLALLEAEAIESKKTILEIKQSILDLNDDDEDNDQDALTRLGSVASQIPNLAKGFDAMKGLFKTA